MAPELLYLLQVRLTAGDVKMAKVRSDADKAVTVDYYTAGQIAWLMFPLVVGFLFLHFRLNEFEWDSVYSLSYVVESIIHRYLFF